MRRNLRTGLRARPRTRPSLDVFDRLPPDLRRWLRDATLPWSPESALRLWRKALAEGATEDEALCRLAAAEARLVARDAAAIWGPAHPAAPQCRQGQGGQGQGGQGQGGQGHRRALMPRR